MLVPGVPEEFFERVESLGDNCEFGFVCRALGYEQGSLFRWASMPPTALMALLTNQLRHIFEYENLSPLRPDMVEEAIYKIGWHAAMKSALRDGKLAFLAEPEELTKSFAFEQRKFAYLSKKFVTRLQQGGVIYFLKCNAGIDRSVVDVIIDRLQFMAKGAPFSLVHVRLAADGETPGEVRRVSERRFEALISRFASYELANDLDLDAWTRIIQGVAAQTEFGNWDIARSRTALEMQRAFAVLPLGDRNSTTDTSSYEKAYETCRLSIENARPWTRVVDELALRIHAPPPDGEPTRVTWSGLALPGGATLEFRASDVVAEGIAVQADVRAKDSAGLVLAAASAVMRDGGVGEVRLAIPANATCVSVEMDCFALVAIPEGLRAAIDLEPPIVVMPLA